MCFYNGVVYVYFLLKWSNSHQTQPPLEIKYSDSEVR